MNNVIKDTSKKSFWQYLFNRDNAFFFTIISIGVLFIFIKIHDANNESILWGQLGLYITIATFILMLLSIITKYIEDNDSKREEYIDHDKGDILSQLHNYTNKVILKTIKLITLRTFISFALLFVICIVLKDHTSVNETIINLLSAVCTTLFTIWVIEILYNSQMDSLNSQKINNTLMKIFENRDWIRQMHPKWRKTAINECLIGQFGDELGSRYAEKIIESQFNKDTYRLNFDYKVSLKKCAPKQYCLGQELSYKKRIPYDKDGDNQKDIFSIFEFKEDPFYEPKNDTVFFREEIRSEALIMLLRRSPDIASKIKDLKLTDTIVFSKTNAFREIMNDIQKDVKTEILYRKNNLAAAIYSKLQSSNSETSILDKENIKIYIKKEYFKNDNSEKVSKEIDDIYNGMESIYNNINEYTTSIITAINNLWTRHINAHINNENKTCKDIVLSLINYECYNLDKEGCEKNSHPENTEVFFIVNNKDTGNQVEQSKSTDITAEEIVNVNSPYNYKDIRGIKLKSKIDLHHQDNSSYFYAKVKCNYLVHKQYAFYWKFGEPMISTNFSMTFPDEQDMEQVHAVQYFSDKHQHINKNNNSSSISFHSDDLLLPESGVYIHWTNENTK